MISNYRCETCSHHTTDQVKNGKHIWHQNKCDDDLISEHQILLINNKGCASHSDFHNQREKVMDDVVKILNNGMDALEELQVDGYSSTTITAKRDVIGYLLEKIEELRQKDDECGWNHNGICAYETDHFQSEKCKYSNINDCPVHNEGKDSVCMRGLEKCSKDCDDCPDAYTCSESSK